MPIAVTVIVALAILVLSVIDAAVTVTVAGLGTLAGAVKVTAVDVMLLNPPQVAPEQPAPERLQITPWFWESFCTVAVNG